MAKPLVVIICLEDWDIFEEINTHFISKLSARAEVRQVRNASDARRYLISSVRPHAVIIADGLVSPVYRDIIFKLVVYVKSGGTVIFGGIFGAYMNYGPQLRDMFRDVWGLPWRAANHTSEVYVVNPHTKRINAKEATNRFRMTGWNIDNVALEDAVYLPPREVKKLIKGKNSQHRCETYKTLAALATVGWGRVGYAGYVNMETEMARLILAMCFCPGSRAPIAPGTGTPRIEYTGIAVESMSTVDSSLSKRSILILSLEKEEWLDEHYSQLSRALRKNATVTEALVPRTATRALSASTRPSAVLVTDAAITEDKYTKVLTRLVEYAHGGGTVVLGAQFSNHFAFGASRKFFERWSVPWDLGSYHRTTFALNPTGLPPPLSQAALFPSYSMKTLHLKNVPHAYAVYLPTTDSRVESHVFAPTRIEGEKAEESPAVFAPVGNGFLGYVGDVNGEQGTLRLLIEMCGVKIKPGDMGPRTFTSSVSFRNGQVESTKTTEQELPLPLPAPPPLPPRGPRERDADVAARAEARAKVRREKSEEAETLKNEGNELFRTEKWAQAVEKYRAAAFLAGPQPVYMSNLAAALLKLKLPDAAESAASRAIAHDPKHVKSLYRRAIARKEQNRFIAAADDLRRLLAIDRTNAPALAEREEVQKRLQRGRSSYDRRLDIEEIVETNENETLEVEDESDSEDFAHAGNGTSCKFYNHDGCRFGICCRFKHAPDSKSVRDELGRNVCVYWLVGECRFGERCIYAHDQTYLPTQGWWTNTARLDRMREQFNDAAVNAPIPLSPGASEDILAEALKPASWRNDLWAAHSLEVEVAAAEGRTTGVAEEDEDSWEDEDEDEDEYEEFGWEREWDERAENFGHTREDVEDMLMYGIKPYDSDAFEELMYIRAALGEY